LSPELERVIVSAVIVHAVVDDAPDSPLGDSLEVFIRREDGRAVQ
jgi:hypothetical protein